MQYIEIDFAKLFDLLRRR